MGRDSILQQRHANDIPAITRVICHRCASSQQQGRHSSIGEQAALRQSRLPQACNNTAVRGMTGLTWKLCMPPPGNSKAQCRWSGCSSRCTRERSMEQTVCATPRHSGSEAAVLDSSVERLTAGWLHRRWPAERGCDAERGGARGLGPIRPAQVRACRGAREALPFRGPKCRPPAVVMTHRCACL